MALLAQAIGANEIEKVVWNGPWKIIKFKSPLVVEIEHCSKKTKHGKFSRQTVHVDRLTPCKLETEVETEDDVEPSTSTQGVVDTQSDSHVVDDMQLDSQVDTQVSMSDSLRPTCTRKLPKSLEGYIL